MKFNEFFAISIFFLKTQSEKCISIKNQGCHLDFPDDFSFINSHYILLTK